MKTHQNKLRNCILALTFLVLSGGLSQAQTSKKVGKDPNSPISSSQKSELTAIQELEQFKPHPSDQHMNGLQYELLKFRAQLEEGQKNGSLSNVDEQMLTANITKVRTAINDLNASRSGKIENKSTSLPTVKNSNGLIPVTRAQYIKVDKVGQKDIACSGNYVVSDLVNARSFHKSSRIDGLFYLTVEQFSHAPNEKRIHILQNPELYIIFQNAAEIPKAKMSRQEFQSLSAAKQEYILNSNDFVIE